MRVSFRINLIVILTLIIFLTPLLMEITGSNYMKLIEDAAYILLLMYSIQKMLQRKYSVSINKPVIALILLVVISAIIGIYYNGISLVILQFREFKYLLLIIISIPYTDIEYFKNVWTVLKIIGLICIPVSIIQWLIYKSDGDRVTGILGYGASGTLTLFLLIIFFSELAVRLNDNKPISGWYFLFLIPTLLNETKITLVLFPIMLFIVLYLTKKLNSYRAIAIISIAGLFTVIWAIAYQNTYGRDIFSIFSNKYINEYLYATHWEGDAGRLAKINFAFDIIKEGNLLFGYGLGSSYSGATSGLSGFIHKEYYRPEMFGGTRPQLFLSLLDFGLIGTVLIVIIIMLLFYKVLKQKGCSLEKFIAINSFVIVLTTLIYQNIFYTYQIMYILVLYTIIYLRTVEVNKG